MRFLVWFLVGLALSALTARLRAQPNPSVSYGVLSGSNVPTPILVNANGVIPFNGN